MFAPLGLDSGNGILIIWFNPSFLGQDGCVGVGSSAARSCNAFLTLFAVGSMLPKSEQGF